MSIAGPDGVAHYLSPGIERMLGYHPDDPAAGGSLRLVHPDDLAHMIAAMHQSLASPGVPITREARFRCADGSWKTLELTGTNLLDDPAIGGIVINVRDVSERRAVEDALRASEERYRRIVETTGDGIWTTDVEGRITFVNQAMADMLGYRVEELVGRPASDFLDAALAGVTAGRRARRRQTRIEQHDARVRHRDGRPIWCRVAVSPLEDAEGQHIGSLAVMTDITERRAAEQRFRTLVESIPDYVVRFDRSCRFLYANPAACRAYGRPLEEIVGKTFADLGMRPEIAAQLSEVIGAAFATGTPQQHEFALLFDGQIRWLHGVVVPEHDDRGDCDSVLAVVRDIDDLRHAQQERAALLEREREARAAAEAERARLAFLAAATRAIDEEIGLAERIATIARMALPMLGDWCIVDFTGSAPAPPHIAVAHVDPAREAAMRATFARYLPERATGERYARFLAEGRTRVTDPVPDDWLSAEAVDAAHREALLRLGLRGHISIPLAARGRTFGVLVVGNGAPERPYDHEAFVLAEEYAHRAAVMIDNALLVAEARDAEERGRLHAERLRVLARAGAELVDAAQRIETVLDVVAREAVALVGADVVVRLADAEGRLAIVAVAQREGPTYISLGGQAPVFTVDQAPFDRVASGAAVWFQALDAATLPALAPAYADYLREIGADATLLAPLRARGEFLGVLGAKRPAGMQPFTEEDVGFFQELADRAALAIDNARLYEQAQDAAAEAWARAEQLRALADFSRTLAEAPFDVDTITHLITDTVGRLVGDTCILRLLDDDGRTLPVRAMFHPDRAMVALVRDIESPPLRLGEGLPGRVAATGEPLLIPRVAAEDLPALVGERFSAYFRRYPIASVLIVPLRARGRVVGTLGLSRTTLQRPYDEGDREFVLSLADRAALAIDNVRLYIEQEDLARARNQALTEIAQLNASLEQRVRERTAELEAANRELEAFAYSVTHDLRAPLRGIDGFSLALLEEYDAVLDDTARSYLQRVRGASQRMNQLIDDLLGLSRVTRATMSREAVDLSQLAHATIDMLRARDPQRAIEVIIQPGLVVRGDQRLLQILLQNLLENAWKFTSKRALARIEVGRAPTEGPPIIFVRDNGAGFDMRYVERIFTPFQRLHTAEEFEGAGIGLATVQRIINRHGGRVWAEATPGEGATFYFTLGA